MWTNTAWCKNGHEQGPISIIRWSNTYHTHEAILKVLLCEAGPKKMTFVLTHTLLKIVCHITHKKSMIKSRSML